jgi:hypothetical protein
VQLDEMADHRQPQAEATVAARVRRVALAEALEDVGQEIGGDAFAGVLDHEAHGRGRSTLHAHGDAAAARRELDGIRGQVSHDLPQPVGIAHDEAGAGIEHGLDLEALRGGRRINGSMAAAATGASCRGRTFRRNFAPTIRDRSEDVRDDLGLCRRVALDGVEARGGRWPRRAGPPRRR